MVTPETQKVRGKSMLWIPIGIILFAILVWFIEHLFFNVQAGPVLPSQHSITVGNRGTALVSQNVSSRISSGVQTAERVPVREQDQKPGIAIPKFADLPETITGAHYRITRDKKVRVYSRPREVGDWISISPLPSNVDIVSTLIEQCYNARYETFPDSTTPGQLEYWVNGLSDPAHHGYWPDPNIKNPFVGGITDFIDFQVPPTATWDSVEVSVKWYKLDAPRPKPEKKH